MQFESVQSLFRSKDYPTPVLTSEQHSFFLQSVDRGRNFNVASAAVLQTVIDVDRTHFHELFGLDTAKEYAIRIMNISPNMAWTFYYIALKCRDVPALNAAVQKHEISLSAARRLVPVIDKDNCEAWIEKAKSMPIAKLEREVANASPLEHAHTTERMKAIPNDLHRVEFCLTQDEMDMLQRAREVMSQKLQKPASLQDVFVEGLKLLCEKHDPLEKARRHREREEKRAKHHRERAEKPAQHHRAQTEKHNVSKSGSPTHASGSRADAGCKDSNHKPSSSTHSTISSGPPRENQSNRKGRPASSSRDENLSRSRQRTPIPAAVLHEVNLKQKRRCHFKRSDGSICGNRHFLDYHHITPVSEGGANDAENIVTLCSRCHRRTHSH